MSAKNFQNYSVHIQEEVKDSVRNLHNAWTLPGAFNPLQYINELPYM